MMRIESPSFKNNEQIPKKYTCDGDDLSPPLVIIDVPQGTKSLVLIVDDPDAPRGTWVHWTMWNIPPETGEIIEGGVPKRANQGVTDFGRPGYGGPCPHMGTHRYFFKVYALDTELELPESARVGDIEKSMAGHILEQTELVGIYARAQ